MSLPSSAEECACERCVLGGCTRGKKKQRECFLFTDNIQHRYASQVNTAREQNMVRVCRNSGYTAGGGGRPTDFHTDGANLSLTLLLLTVFCFRTRFLCDYSLRNHCAKTQIPSPKPPISLGL